VCDEPHPLLVKDMIQACVTGDIDAAYRIMSHLWGLGYAPEDIISIIFRVCKTHTMPEYLKLEFIKVLVNISYYICLIAEKGLQNRRLSIITQPISGFDFHNNG
jgi:Replication factor C C-terminal domain